MKLKWLVTGVASLLILAAPAISHADTSNFTVTDFTADYSLSKSDPQGDLTVEESLSVLFADYNHGILRALPQKYNGQNLHLTVRGVERDGHTEPYTTYTSNGNKVLKIGSASQTITGQHTYDIRYTVQNVIRFTADHDELDWNTNGTQWLQPFEHVTAKLHFPVVSKGIGRINPKQVTTEYCATGIQGSTARDCIVQAEGDGYAYETTRTLSPGENMTFVADFPL